MANRNVAWMLVLVLIALMFWRLPPILARRDSIYKTFSPLVVVRNQIQQHYVESIDDQTLLEGAIEGMMNRLDPFSAYIAPPEYADFKKRTEGVFSGIGIELAAPDGVLTIISPIENTPAFYAGVRAGDRILGIDGHSARGMSTDEAVKRISGKAHTDVTLTLLHSDQRDPVKITITRAPITIHSVRGWMRAADNRWDYRLDPIDHIDYIRISTFIEKTASEFSEALDHVLDNDGRGLILDLRANPGGLLDAAVDIVDCFISEGLIVLTRERQGGEERYSARRQTIAPDLPLVVLVDGGSASASEIVAGALQDHKRAVILGVRTYGKGSVQNVIEIDSGRSAIKLTTAYYYLPLGRRIHRTTSADSDTSWDLVTTPATKPADEPTWGVHPDIVVRLSEERIEKVREARRRYDVIQSNGAQSAPATSAPTSRPSPDALRKILMDEQVERAVEELRRQLHGLEKKKKIVLKPAA